MAIASLVALSLESFPPQVISTGFEATTDHDPPLNRILQGPYLETLSVSAGS